MNESQALFGVIATIGLSSVTHLPVLAETAVQVFDSNITLEEVENAQRAWCIDDE